MKRCCFLRMVSIVALSAPLSACSGDDSAAEDTAADDGATSNASGDDGGSAGSDGADSTGEATILIVGVVTDFATMMNLEGVEVCLFEHPEVACATSDENGAYQLPGVPPNTDGALITSAEGYVPFALWGNTGSVDLQSNLALASNDLLDVFAATLGVEIDETTGTVTAPFGDGPQGTPGVVFSMDPASGTGPVYLNDAGLPTIEQEGTGADGLGGWVLVDPGDAEVSGAVDGTPCVPSSNATLGSAPNSARVTILAGYVNSVAGGFDCG